jgi:phosphoribosylamine--glycine ligase
MKVLIIGNGARENAIAWKIFNSNSFSDSEDSQIFVTQGNPGFDPIARSINIFPADYISLVNFAVDQNIDLTIVGPELPLSEGIVDLFKKHNLRIFGPPKYAARIESSKIFAKNFMSEAGIPTSKYKSFNESDIDKSIEFLNTCSFPVVIKADGLASGKGVFIAEKTEEAKKVIEDLAKNKILGDSGKEFLIEEFLNGEELSLFIITDGRDYVILPPARDYKKSGDGNVGKNTGGMGAYAPAFNLLTEYTLNKIKEQIIEPVLRKFDDFENRYSGCLYCGLMINENGDPFVIEFNCRFGDPETQAVLPLIQSDFLKLLYYTAESKLGELIVNEPVKFNHQFTCCIVLASKGYPDFYESGKIVHGLEKLDEDCLVFHAATKFSDDKKVIVTNGGRVLSVVGVSTISLDDASRIAYSNVNKINYENMYFRKDIANSL